MRTEAEFTQTLLNTWRTSNQVSKYLIRNLPSGLGPNDVVVGDLDADGKSDMVSRMMMRPLFLC